MGWGFQSVKACTVPLRIESVANLREHWSKRAKRAKMQREAIGWHLGKARPALPCVVNLTRIAPRPLDGDNLQGGFKAVRDGIADWLGVDDGSESVGWVYRQRKGAPKQYAVEVEFLSA
jgi:hypothetical protein